jgi:glutamyl-tRNA reductase
MRVEQNREERLQEAEKAERMVAEEVVVLRQWLKSLEVTPTIVALRARTEEIKRAELEKTLGRLGHLSNHERELVENLASAIVNKLIHGAMVTLKAEANSSGGAMFVEAARRFFCLEEAPTGRSDHLNRSDRWDRFARLATPAPRPEPFVAEEATEASREQAGEKKR